MSTLVTISTTRLTHAKLALRYAAATSKAGFSTSAAAGQRCLSVRSSCTSRFLRAPVRRKPIQTRHNSTSVSSNASPTSSPPHVKPPSSTSTTTATTTTATAKPTTTTTLLHTLFAPARLYAHLATTRPNSTQLLSSLAIYALGDLLSQYIRSPLPPPASPTNPTPSAPSFWSSTWDPHRTLRALAIGGTASLPAYYYFLWLARAEVPIRWLQGSFVRGLLGKVLVNQLTFAPVISSYFFAAHVLLSSPARTLQQPGTVGREAWDRVKETVPGAWVAGLAVWPAVTAVNFSVVGVRYRSVVAGLVAVGWQGYLGWVDLRARERAREGSVERGGVGVVV